MTSHKRSAKRKRLERFRAELEEDAVEGDGAWSRAGQRERRLERGKDAARARKMCTSKNRYSSEGEALTVAEDCMAHGSPELHAYKCPLCEGWHLTSRKD